MRRTPAPRGIGLATALAPALALLPGGSGPASDGLHRAGSCTGSAGTTPAVTSAVTR